MLVVGVSHFSNVNLELFMLEVRNCYNFIYLDRSCFFLYKPRTNSGTLIKVWRA